MDLVKAAESCRPMRRLVKSAQNSGDTHTNSPNSRKILTPANGLSLARPLIAGRIARNIARSKGHIRTLAVAMIMTDAEGIAARKIDKWFPESGRGVTVHGTKADVMADTGSLVITAAALFVSPKTDVMSRTAIGLIGIQEAYKSIWAIGLDRQYKQVSGGEHPPVAPTPIGKESMLEKLLAAGCALNAHETRGLRRTLYGVSALGFGILGVLHAESARRDYTADINRSIAELQFVPQPEA